MATKTFEELKQMAIQIRDEKTNKQNTATRIGTQMIEHLNKLEQEYYNKDNIDEQKEQTDLKFSNLQQNTGVSSYPTFSQDELYPVGQIINYDDRLYEFTVEHAPGAWDNSHVKPSSIKNDTDKKFSELETNLLILTKSLDKLSQSKYKDISTTWSEGKYLSPYDGVTLLDSQSGGAVTDYIDITGKKVQMYTATSTAWALVWYYDEYKQPIRSINAEDLGYTFSESGLANSFTFLYQIFNPKAKYARFVGLKRQSFFKLQYCDFILTNSIGLGNIANFINNATYQLGGNYWTRYDGKFIRSYTLNEVGQPVLDSSHTITDYIPIKGKRLKIIGTPDNVIAAFYDENYNFVGNVLKAEYDFSLSNEFDITKHFGIDNAVYGIFVIGNDTINQQVLLGNESFSVDGGLSYSRVLEDVIDSLGKKQKISIINKTENKFLGWDGSLKDSTVAYVTDFIDASANPYVLTTGAADIWALACFYDKDKNFIGKVTAKDCMSYMNTTNSSSSRDYIISQHLLNPLVKYIRFTLVNGGALSSLTPIVKNIIGNNLIDLLNIFTINTLDCNFYFIDKSTFVSGYIDYKGEVASSNYAVCSDYIDIRNRIARLRTFSSSVWHVAFYDENKNFISAIPLSDDMSIVSTYYFYEYFNNNNIAYARFSVSVALEKCDLSISNVSFNYINNETIASLAKSYNEFSAIPETGYEATNTNYSSGYLNPSDGTVVSSTDSMITSMIMVDNNLIYKVNTVQKQSWALVCFYDANRQFLFSVKCSDYAYYNNDTKKYEFIIYQHLLNTNARYFRVTVSGNSTLYNKVTEAKIVKDFQGHRIHDLIFKLGNMLQLNDFKTVDTVYTVDKFLDAAGLEKDSTSAAISDYIPIQRKRIKIKYNTVSAWNIGFYDKNKTLIRTMNSSTLGFIDLYSNNVNREFIYDYALKDSNVAYFRATVIKTRISQNPILIADYDISDKVGDLEYRDFVNGVYNLLKNTESYVLNIAYTNDSYLNSTGGVSSSGSKAKVTDIIDVTNYSDIKIYTNSAAAWHWVLYDDLNHIVDILDQTDFGYGSGTIPYTLLNVGDIIKQYLATDRPVTKLRATLGEEGYIIVTEKGLAKKILPEKTSNIPVNFEGIDELNYLSNGTIFDADICFIPMYGQSFTLANDGNYKLTDTFDSNVYMHGENSPTGKGVQVLKKLSTSDNQELIVSDFGDIFSKLVKRFYKAQDILVQSYGMGSRSVLELQKDNGYENPSYHTFEDILMPGVTNAVAAAQAESKTIKCPFFLYLQGESDVVDWRTTGATTTSQCDGDKDRFKTEFVKLKNQVQELIMEKTGQTEKPFVIMYNPGNTNFKNAKNGVSQAVIELTDENDDIFTVGPYYHMTSMGAHPSPDGRRWLAEKFAQVVFDLQMKGRYGFLRVKATRIDINKIFLYCSVPVKPLVVDTWTVPEKTNYGFNVYGNIDATEVIPISNVSVYSDYIVIETAQDVSDIDDLFVTYANLSQDGNGNIRDSYSGRSIYTYESNENGTGTIVYKPLNKNGNEIIGEKYPINNWMPSLGLRVKDLLVE